MKARDNNKTEDESDSWLAHQGSHSWYSEAFFNNEENHTENLGSVTPIMILVVVKFYCSIHILVVNKLKAHINFPLKQC